MKHCAIALLVSVGATACASRGTSPTTRELTRGTFRFDLKLFIPDDTEHGEAAHTTSLARHPSGDLIVTVQSSAPIDLEGGEPLSGDAVVVARIKPSGELVWARTLRGDGALAATAPDGRVFLAVTSRYSTAPPAFELSDDARAQSGWHPPIDMEGVSFMLMALSADGEHLWTRSPRTPGGMFWVHGFQHHEGQLIVAGSITDEEREAPWDVQTDHHDDAVVTWWSAEDGALTRSFAFGGEGYDIATDVLPLEGGDVIVSGTVEGPVTLGEGVPVDAVGPSAGLAFRLTEGGEVTWAKTWDPLDENSGVDANYLARTRDGVAVVGDFRGEIELYEGLGGEDQYRRVFIEELTLGGEHLREYVIDGFHDQTHATAVAALEDGAIAIALVVAIGGHGDAPTLELTDASLTPRVGARMTALVRLDLGAGRLELIERWDGVAEPQKRRGEVDVAALLPGKHGVHVGGTITGASTFGVRVVTTPEHERSCSYSRGHGKIRHVIGGPFSGCGPSKVEAAYGFIHLVSTERSLRGTP